ncbi:MAG: hypothetical protein VB013_05690 [Anaerolineaceae bacterium]|nr:hypothetical protein [Anaerolineaceae bacterium]
MTYPLSAEVTAGQPTAAAHYNNLRKDALTLGNNEADSIDLATYFAHHANNFTLQKLSSNRLRVPYSANFPATIVINGCLLKARGNVDLPANLIQSIAGTWYIFAVRTPGSTTFTLTANTTSAESTNQRLVGEVYYTGDISYIECYLNPKSKLSDPDYESAWFAVSYQGTYVRAHNLGVTPSLITLVWCLTAGTTYQVPVTVVVSTAPTQGEYNPLYADESNITVITGNSASYDATCHSRVAQSTAGYYKIRAYK